MKRRTDSSSGSMFRGRLNMVEYSSDTLNRLVLKYQTPFYIYFEEKIHKNYQDLNKAFAPYGKVQIAYSIKNCCVPKIVKCVEQHSPWYEVTSVGEMRLLRRMGIPLSKAIFTNIYKSDESLRLAIRNKLGLFAIDSHSDLMHVKSLAAESERPVKILVRVNPALENMKDTVFASSVPWSKTGVEVCKNAPDCAEDLLVEASNAENVEVHGIHGHLGSQVENLDYYRLFMEAILNFYSKMNSKYNLSMDTIDLGGGYPVRYDPNRPVPTVKEIASLIIDLVRRHDVNPSLIIESGRYITADAGLLVTRVVGTKQSPSIGKVILIDASTYNHLLDSILVDWYFEVEKVGASEGPREEAHIVGCTNDALDHLDPAVDGLCPSCAAIIPRKRLRQLPQINEGDTLVIKNAGAYTTCFNNNYCLLPRCPVLFRSRNGRTLVARRQESIDDMLSQYVM